MGQGGVFPRKDFATDRDDAIPVMVVEEVGEGLVAHKKLRVGTVNLPRGLGQCKGELGNRSKMRVKGHDEGLNQELLDQRRRTKLRKRPTKESSVEAGGFLAAGCEAAGVVGGAGTVAAATSSPSTRPWKISVGRTRTRRTRTIIFGSMSGCTGVLAL